MQHHRALWSAVVLHAVGDIDAEHYRSVEYGEAVAFFIGGGAWGESRQAIADCLNLHSDDLTRLGRAAIAARHLRDGVPPISVRAAVTVAAQPTTPRPVVPPPDGVPVVTRAEVIRRPDPPAKREYRRRPGDPPRDRDWWIRRFLDKQVA